MSGRLIRNAQIHLIAFSIPKAPNCASGGQLYGPQLAHEISKKAIVEVESTPIRVTIFLSRSIMIIFRCWINRNHDECICNLLDTRGRCYLRARPARPTLLRSCYNEHSFNFPLRSDLKHEVHTRPASDLHGFSKDIMEPTKTTNTELIEPDFFDPDFVDPLSLNPARNDRSVLGCNGKSGKSLPFVQWVSPLT